MQPRFSWLTASLFMPALALAGSTPQGLIEFQISGGTVLPALIEADVEVHIGDLVIPGTTDESGRYTLEVGCGGDLDALVVIKAYGTGDQAGLAMARVSESCGRLRDAATGSLPEIEIGPLTPVSTGLYATVRWYVQDQPDLEWPLARSTFHPQLALVQANHTGLAARAVIYQAHGFAPLPAGTDHTLDLLVDRPALVAYTGDVETSYDLDEFLPTLRRVFWNAQLSTRPSIPAPPDLILTWCPALQLSCNSHVELLEQGDAPFTFRHFRGLGEWFDRGMQDLLFGDRMEVPVDNLRALRLQGPDGEPLAIEEGVQLIGDPAQPIPREIRTVWVDYRLSNASELIGLIATDLFQKWVYPENPEIPIVTFPQNIPNFSLGKTHLEDLPESTPPEVGERWALGLLNDTGDPSRILKADVIEFVDTDTALSMLGNNDFAWQFVDGTLVLTEGDTTYRFTQLGQTPERHGAFLASHESAETDIGHEQIVGIRANVAPSFDAEEVPGRYVGAFSFDNAIPLGNQYPLLHFTFDLYPDGTGLNISLIDLEAEMPSAAIPLTWEIDEDGALVINRQINHPTSTSWRRWIPVAETTEPNDLYLLESQPEFIPPGEVPSFAEYRLTYYRRFDLPE